MGGEPRAASRLPIAQRPVPFLGSPSAAALPDLYCRHRDARLVCCSGGLRPLEYSGPAPRPESPNRGSVCLTSLDLGC